MSDTIEWVTADQVIDAHGELLRTYGGLAGGGHRGDFYEGVEAAVQAVQNSYYENIHELAAAYAVYIVQGHVFLDGNKRAASFAMFTFLLGNGASVVVSPERAIPIMVELQQRSEQGERTDDLIRWVASKISGRHY